MSDTNQDPKLDLDNLTDDEVMNLSSDQIEALSENSEIETDDKEDKQESETEDNDEKDQEENTEDNESSDDDDENDNDQSEDSEEDNEENQESNSESKESKQESNKEEEDSDKNESESSKKSVSKDDDKSSKTEKKQEKQSSEKDDSSSEKDAEANIAKQELALDFFNKITAPFKADGKDITIRSPEDAIRLMQMGTNYSRRMQEMKPLRAMDSMLKQHGLDNPEALSYLIDLKEGKPEAIQKLLKEKNIDPLDIDTSKDSTYKTSNYSADPVDVNFQEAIDNTLVAPGGHDILTDINNSWDDESKSALRESPEILDNLLIQKNSGIYEKIKEELNYQRTTGHLTNVPFLQAYNAVGDAMSKAGVFDNNSNQSNGMAPLKSKAKSDPIDTGTRKAASKPKTEQPNPNLSSTPRRSSTNNTEEKEIDYASISDADFLKLSDPGS